MPARRCCPASSPLAEAAGPMDGPAFLTALRSATRSRSAPASRTTRARRTTTPPAPGTRWVRRDRGETARLLGERLRHALGIAEYHGPRSQMMRCIDFPTMVKDGSGWGAIVGLSAVFAADGFTGAPALVVGTARWRPSGRISGAAGGSSRCISSPIPLPLGPAGPRGGAHLAPRPWPRARHDRSGRGRELPRGGSGSTSAGRRPPRKLNTSAIPPRRRPGARHAGAQRCGGRGPERSRHPRHERPGPVDRGGRSQCAFPRRTPGPGAASSWSTDECWRARPPRRVATPSGRSTMRRSWPSSMSCPTAH